MEAKLKQTINDPMNFTYDEREAGAGLLLLHDAFPLAKVKNDQFNVVKQRNSHSDAIKKNGPRVHRCPMCEATFMSGQALGGHMGKHRSRGRANVENVGRNGVEREGDERETGLSATLDLASKLY